MVHKAIQIVDANGNYVGLAPSPTEARNNSHIRLMSRVNLQNNQGYYLLQKRADHMDAWPGCWDHSAAGHVDEGESPELAAYRELAEEIGVTDVSLRHECELYHQNPTDADGLVNRMYSHFYSAVFNGDITKLKLEPEEVSEVRWFSLAEIKQIITNSPQNVTDGVAMYFGKLS